MSPHCSRCGIEDDSVVLHDDGLCASCASDRDERENEDRSPTSPERAVGPTLPLYGGSTKGDGR